MNTELTIFSALLLSIAMVARAHADGGALPSDALNLPDRYRAHSAGDVSETPWWRVLNDPELERLIGAALEDNFDLRAAVHRVSQSAAIAEQARAPLYPVVSADLSINVVPRSSLGFQFGGLPRDPTAPEPPTLFGTGSAFLTLRYAVDSWWRQYLAAEAADSVTKASESDRDGFALTLAFQIADAYYNAVSANEQLAVLKRQLKLNDSLLEIVQLRFERGEASGLTVLQQKQQRAATAARVPPLRAQLRIELQRLLVLTGAPPSAPEPKIASTLPSSQPLPAIGAPADLLSNRPDLRAAMHRWQAADDASEDAVREHFPTLGLTAQAGVQGAQGETLNTQEVWSAGLALSIPIFRGGADVAGVRRARAEANAAHDMLRQLSLRVTADVESSMIRQEELGAQLDALKTQLDAAQQTFEESKARYVAGLETYLNVLLALGSVQQLELTVIQAERALLTARIQLHQAVGGPWTEGLSRGASS